VSQYFLSRMPATSDARGKAMINEIIKASRSNGVVKSLVLPPC
jgi:hypothetical protein